VARLSARAIGGQAAGYGSDFEPPPTRETAMTHRDSIELDFRTADRIDVRLLWDPATDRATVTAHDTRSGEVLEVAVRRDENAMDVFHHPYAYAAFHGVEPQPVSEMLAA
jgi:hypothetical protein